MSTEDIARSFDELFAGRRDVYGVLNGGCVQGEVHLQRWIAHLEGRQSLGIYPLVAQQNVLVGTITPRVRWGCSDIDLGYEESLPHAKNLRTALKVLGVESWIERTKGKGFHVWVFALEWVPAVTMRNAFLAAHQLIDLPPREVNPKQTSLVGLKGFGSYVNIPYFAWGLDGTRCCFIDEDTRWPARMFVDQALRYRTPTDVLEKAASAYIPPPPVRAVDVDTEYSGELEPLVRRMHGLAFVIFRDGPFEGADRSTTLAHLAYELAEDEADFTPPEALALMRDADSRWGKFADRPDCDEQLGKIVRRAFG